MPCVQKERPASGAEGAAVGSESVEMAEPLSQATQGQCAQDASICHASERPWHQRQSFLFVLNFNLNNPVDELYVHISLPHNSRADRSRIRTPCWRV